MKTRILVLAVLNVLAAFAVASAGGQAQWDERAVQDGVEFWLLNDEGTAIVLQCTDQEVRTAFVFTEPIVAATGALVIGQLVDVEPGSILPPRLRQNFPVAQVNDRTVQIVTGRGLDFTLAMLAAAANIHVRAAGRRASFEVAGSDSMLAHCPRAEERVRTGYGISAFGRFTGWRRGHTSGAATGTDPYANSAPGANSGPQ